MLTRRSFLAGGAAAAAASLVPELQGQKENHKQEAAQSEAPPSKAITKVVTGHPLALDQVKASGWLAERLERAVVALDNLSVAVWWNVIGTWGYTLPATWLRDVLFTEQYAGTSHPRLTEVANQLITMQAEGKLRLDYRKNKIGVYEDGELIRGLVAYYQVRREARALDAAKAVGRFIAENRHLTHHYYSGLAVGPLLKLADASGEAAFVDLAAKIAEEEQLKCLEVKEGTHGAVPSMIGEAYLALFEKTGNRRYLDWAVQGWRAMRERMFVTGGIGEVLFFTKPPEDSNLHDETCQTSWWFMFNLALWRVTGDVKYLDLAEHVLLNHFFFQQLRRGEGEGGFHALGDVDQGFRGDHNYFCCDVEGAFGYFELGL